jgi:hypothetical protein
MTDRPQALPETGTATTSTADILSAESMKLMGAPAGTGDVEYTLAFNMSVHKRMDNQVLGKRLSDQALFALNYGNISQDAASAKTGKMDHHFCNNMLARSLNYTDEVQREIIKDLGSKKRLSDEDLMNIVRKEGARIHVLQDFYAHSNYTELNLQKNPALKLGEIPLMNWNDLRNGNAADLRSGFYFYKNGGINELANQMTRQQVIEGLSSLRQKIPGTKYMNDFLYERDRERGFAGALHIANEKRYTVLHADTAKDDAAHPQGEVINPRTGINLFSYARDLALRETRQQWNEFEDTVRNVRGADDGAAILKRIHRLSIQVERQKWYKEFPEGFATKNAEVIS